MILFFVFHSTVNHFAGPTFRFACCLPILRSYVGWSFLLAAAMCVTIQPLISSTEQLLKVNLQNIQKKRAKRQIQQQQQQLLLRIAH